MTWAKASIRRHSSKPMSYNTKYPGYLIHYGISGQKWGIRRYQNEDGTLSEEGKRRYNEGPPESETWKKSEAKNLTDEELRRRTNRLQQEQNYKNLTTTDSERNAQNIKNDFIKKVLTAAAITPVVALVGIAGKKYLGKAVSFIGQFGKRLIRKIRSRTGIKNIVNTIQKQYINNPKNKSWEYRLQKDFNNNVARKSFRTYAWPKGERRMFNYRPRVNNSLPRTREWPKL